MHGTDAAGFQEALINLALVRGTLGDGNDSRFVRSRIAFMLWPPGLLLVLMLAVTLQSEAVVVVGVTTPLLALWRFGAVTPKTI
jgi:hypothetical protein